MTVSFIVVLIYLGKLECICPWFQRVRWECRIWRKRIRVWHWRWRQRERRN